MNTSAIGISVIGVVSSVFTCCMNVFLLKKIMDSKRKKQEMILFYYRFCLDVFLGFLVASFLSCAILYCLDMEGNAQFQNFIFYLALPSSNVGAIRSIVTLAITVERNLAAYTPIFFHNYRQHLPTITIFLFAVCFGLFEDVVLFQICNFTLNIPKKCAAFGCTINSCFLGYWTTHKSVVFALMLVFSITLCVKLFILNKFGQNSSSELSRVNLLALIDAGNVCIFDFLPSFIANQWSNTQFFAFQNIGPYGAVAKLLGCAIEAYLVFRTLVRKGEFKVSESSKSLNKRNSVAGNRNGQF